MLLEGLDDAAGVTGDESARAGPRGEQFAAMVRRVARDFESHPLRDQFIQLLQDERELLDEQIPPLVEYLYSSVVNNFKGEIAELLARPVIHRYARRFTAPMTLISGWAIAEPKLRSSRLVWAKGADGLLVVEGGRVGGDRLGIAAVIEIKSYRLNPEEMALQARKHVHRLRRGHASTAASWPETRTTSSSTPSTRAAFPLPRRPRCSTSLRSASGRRRHRRRKRLCRTA